MKDIVKVASIFAFLIWNIFIWAGTFYLIAVHSFSPWWVVLTIILTMTRVKFHDDSVEGDSGEPIFKATFK